MWIIAEMAALSIGYKQQRLKTTYHWTHNALKYTIPKTEGQILVTALYCQNGFHMIYRDQNDKKQAIEEALYWYIQLKNTKYHQFAINGINQLQKEESNIDLNNLPNYQELYEYKLYSQVKDQKLLHHLKETNSLTTSNNHQDYEFDHDDADDDLAFNSGFGMI